MQSFVLHSHTLVKLLNTAPRKPNKSVELRTLSCLIPLSFINYELYQYQIRNVMSLVILEHSQFFLGLFTLLQNTERKCYSTLSNVYIALHGVTDIAYVLSNITIQRGNATPRHRMYSIFTCRHGCFCSIQ